MHPDCILEVAAAIGRTPSPKELEAFEGGLLDTMRNIARKDPSAWAGMSAAQRLQQAADEARADAIAAADRTASRKASNVLAQSRESERLLARAKVLGGKQAHHDAAFERMRNVDDYVAGVRNEMLTSVVEAIEVVEPRFLGLISDPAKELEFVKAVLGEKVDDPAMVRAAKAYNEGVEAGRLRANAAGADIGKLDYSYLPQPHDVGRIARAGAEKWAADTLPKLKRDQYVRADGSLMDDAEVMDMLIGAWETLATEGRNKITPGAARGGSRASRFDEAHRSIHFKDGESYIAYLNDYGRGSMLDAIVGHVGMMAKTVGMMEELGANPNATYRLLKDLAEQKDNIAGARRDLATLDQVWDTLNGTTAQPVSAKLAEVFQGVRNFTVAAKLQGVMLSAITDAPLQVITARSNGIQMGKAMTSLFEGFGSEKQALARGLGIGMDEISGEVARWHTDNFAQGWTKKLANTTMKATLVEGWSNGLRRGFALTLSETLGRMRSKEWAALSEWDRTRFERGGVTQADWKIWQLAKAEDYKGAQLLTKNGIRDIPDDVLAANGFNTGDVNRATARLLGYLDQEAHTAVLTPDLMTRASMQQGTRAGTWGGELQRTMLLFKSFPVAIIQKHIRRINSIPTGQGKAAYSVAMLTSLTAFGAVSLQLKDLANGKDPRDMTTGKFWMAAFLQGGGIGIFGDIIYTGMGGNARGGQANWTSLFGPVFGTAADALDLTFANAYKAAQGKDTDFGADALRFTKGNTPFLNLWYARAAVDHLVLHDLQEQANPGYLKRMRKRSQKEWNQDYWWEPGDNLPDRAPNVEAIAGEN